jgi:hypothetical protein
MDPKIQQFLHRLETTWVEKVLPILQEKSSDLIDFTIIKGRIGFILGKWKLKKLAHKNHTNLLRYNFLGELQKTGILNREYTVKELAYILIGLIQHLHSEEMLVVANINEVGEKFKQSTGVDNRKALEIAQKIKENSITSLELLLFGEDIDNNE